MTARPDTLPSLSDLDRLFRQKYGDPSAVGWSPRRRYRFGYFLPSDIYEAVVANLVFDGCSWIDVGGGHNVFPENAALARTLVSRCASLVAVDPSDNVHRNPFATTRVQSMIEDYTTDQRFDLATLRMVVEHVAEPKAVSEALAKLLKPGGTVVILTVNKRSPLTLVSALLPFWLHHPIKRVFWGSEEEDTFPVQYKMNSRRDLQACLGAAGLEEVLFAHLDDLATFSQFKRLSWVEALARRTLHGLGLTYPENCLLGVYRKPGESHRP